MTMHFADLGLSREILNALEEKGYQTPTAIQQQAIPAILAGNDVMAAAQTGTGKTAGFILPLLELLAKGKRAKANQVRALVLTPTRELAAQVGDNAAWYRKNLPLSSNVVFGGVKINPQMKRLCKGSDVLIATPGRLLDLYQQNAIRFDQLEVLILDEADRMLDMGFINDIRKILKLLPSQRQNLLFSATFSEEIKALAYGIMNEPLEISVTPKNAAANTVEQWIHPVDKKQKNNLLIHLIKQNNWHQVLVFSRTKHGANRLSKLLEKRGINAAAIHGDKSQGARTRALAEFKDGKLQVLVATDIAARGIDISQLPYVVNVDLPHVSEDYVHRIGRTGRAGETGVAVSLVSADEAKQLKDIERLIKKKLDRKLVKGFEPEEKVPDFKLDTRPFKPKKPKKNKMLDNDSSPNSGKPAPKNKSRGNAAKPNPYKQSARKNKPANKQADSRPKQEPAAEKKVMRQPRKRPVKTT